MLDDVRTAWRRLRHAPVFTLAAIAIIGLAVGCNAAILGVADAVLFRPLPYADPGRVFVIRLANPRTGERLPDAPVPYEYVKAVQEHYRGISALGLRGAQAMGTHVGVQTEWLSTTAVTPSYFRVLGIRPARGRLFDERDAAAPGRAVMLSYECWQRLFGGDGAVIGKSRRVGSSDRDIVGVLPRGFVFPSTFMMAARFGVSGRPDYVTTALPPGPGSTRKFNAVVPPFGAIDAIVRLKPEVSRQQAQAQLDALARTVTVAQPSPNRIGFVPVLEDVRSVVFPTGHAIMVWLLAAAGLVALAGCANLAIMLLARTRLRQMEFGVQLALGAARWRIVRPILMETGIVGVAGACVGVAAAVLTFNVVLSQVPAVTYGGAIVGIDFRVAAIAIALGLLSGLAFGVVPAWRAAGVDVQALIRGRSERAGRSRAAVARPLVTAQVALAIVLVFGAIVAGRAFMSVLQLPLGFTPDKVVTLRVAAPENASTNGFYRQAIEMVARRADVLSAGGASHVPLDGYAPVTDDESRAIGVDLVFPGYLETIGARLLRGRLPRWSDDPAAGACVLTQTAARVLFPAQDPLGRTFKTQGAKETLSVIGVVADIRQDVEGKARPSAFALPSRDDRQSFVLVAQVRARSAAALADMRKQVGRLSPEEPMVSAWWSDDIDALVPFRNPRFQMLVLGTFAALALGFTALGIFAVVSFVIADRRQEIGVRLALGARTRALINFAARQALLPVLVGVIAGLILTRWLASLVKAQLYAMNTEDPVTLVAAVVAVIIAAGIAAYLPARAASRVDPIEVLRAP
ncbi:MAG: ABC transporter permease [Bacteroidales bacterium]